MLLDTGILLRFALVTDPLNSRIDANIQRLVEDSWELCFATQSFREAWNVLTRPVQNGGYELSPAKAADVLQSLETAFVLLEDDLHTFRRWQALTVAYQIIGKSVHDANIVASALAHGATHIWTLNERDFRRYVEIETFIF